MKHDVPRLEIKVSWLSKVSVCPVLHQTFHTSDEPDVWFMSCYRLLGGLLCVLELFIARATFVVLKAWKLLSQHEVYCQVFAPAKHSPSSKSLPSTWKEAFHLVPLEQDKCPRKRFLFAAVVVSHSIAFNLIYRILCVPSLKMCICV